MNVIVLFALLREIEILYTHIFDNYKCKFRN